MESRCVRPAVDDEFTESLRSIKGDIGSGADAGVEVYSRRPHSFSNAVPVRFGKKYDSGIPGAQGRGNELRGTLDKTGLIEMELNDMAIGVRKCVALGKTSCCNAIVYFHFD